MRCDKDPEAPKLDTGRMLKITVSVTILKSEIDKLS